MKFGGLRHSDCRKWLPFGGPWARWGWPLSKIPLGLLGCLRFLILPPLTCGLPKRYTTSPTFGCVFSEGHTTPNEQQRRACNRVAPRFPLKPTTQKSSQESNQPNIQATNPPETSNKHPNQPNHPNQLGQPKQPNKPTGRPTDRTTDHQRAYPTVRGRQSAVSSGAKRRANSPSSAQRTSYCGRSCSR